MLHKREPSDPNVRVHKDINRRGPNHHVIIEQGRSLVRI